MSAPVVIDTHSDEEDFELGNRFTVYEKLGEGTYGTVYRAACRDTGGKVAIKKIKIAYDDEGVPATALREISLLSECCHPNIIRLHDVCSSRSNLFLVFECLDMDLRVYLKKYGALRDGGLRSSAAQCLRGLEFCHSHRILHRDLKPQNVLVDVQSMAFKLADFGLARAFSLPLKPYTHEVVTLWYRSPEILLGQARYGTHVDIWSIGCIVAEMATGKALFPGDSEIDTLFRIFRTLGTPTEEIWPGVRTLKEFKQRFPKWQDTNFADVRRDSGDGIGEEGIALLGQCLRYNDVERPAAKVALRHAFFDVPEDRARPRAAPPAVQQRPSGRQFQAPCSSGSGRDNASLFAVAGAAGARGDNENDPAAANVVGVAEVKGRRKVGDKNDDRHGVGGSGCGNVASASSAISACTSIKACLV